MPSSAFPSPAVTAASRCSASVRRTRFAASLRPGGRAAGRPSGFLSGSLPPSPLWRQRTRLPSPSSASSFERAPSAARTRQIRLIQEAKKRPKAPLAAPGEGWGTDCAPGQSSSPPGPQPRAGGCQRERTRPKGAYAEHTRARRELRTSVRQCTAFKCAYVKYLAL